MRIWAALDGKLLTTVDAALADTALSERGCVEFSPVANVLAADGGKKIHVWDVEVERAH